MKKILAALAITVTMGAPAKASNAPAEFMIAMCEHAATAVELAVRFRQNGVSEKDTLTATNALSSNALSKSLAEKSVRAVYQEDATLFDDPMMKDLLPVMLRNAFLKGCLGAN